MHNFLSDAECLGVVNFTSAAATGIVETGVFNTYGYESIFAHTRFSATNSSNGLQALMGTASASAGLGEVLNSYVAALSTGVGLELYRPMQYVQFQAVRDASCKLGEIWIWGIRPRLQPATQSTARFTGRVLGSPTTGQTTAS